MAAVELTFAVVNEDRILAAMDDITTRLARIERRQARIEQAVTLTAINQEALMADFTALHAEIEANGDAVDSAIVLLNDLAARLVDAADDPAEIQAIAAELAGQSTALAEAVVANTPAAPEPAPEPEPEPAPEG